MTAAPDIVVAVIPHVAGIIGVAGPRQAGQIGVVPGALILVEDLHAQRGAGGPAVQHSGEDARGVALLSGSSGFVPAGGPACHLKGNGLLIQRLPRRQALDYTAHGSAVALAEYRQFNSITRAGRHGLPLPFV